MASPMMESPSRGCAFSAGICGFATSAGGVSTNVIGTTECSAKAGTIHDKRTGHELQPRERTYVTALQIKVQPGTIIATLGATQVASMEQITAILKRHLAGDWGDVDADDAKAIEDALKWGNRVLSSYQVNGEKLWVISEADRSSTTVLTPGEY
jgi:hypothetical protein